MDALTPLANDNKPDNPKAVPGDNNPPSLSETARTRVDALIATADIWSTVKTINSQEQADRAKNALDQLRAEWKTVDDTRKIEKKPHDDAALAVQRIYKPILGALEECAATITPLHTDWLLREEQRLDQERRAAQTAAEAAQREADEAKARAELAQQQNQEPVRAAVDANAAIDLAKQAAAAAAAIPDRARTRGTLGRTASSLRETWYGEVTDVLKAARHYRDHPGLREVLTSLVSADARAGVREVPGCVIKSRKG